MGHPKFPIRLPAPIKSHVDDHDVERIQRESNYGSFGEELQGTMM